MANQERQYEGTSTQFSNSSSQWSLSGVEWNHTQADEDGLYESDRGEERADIGQLSSQLPAYSTQPPSSRTPSLHRILAPYSQSTPTQQHQRSHPGYAPSSHMTTSFLPQQVPPPQHSEDTAVNLLSPSNPLPPQVAKSSNERPTRNMVAHSQSLSAACFVDDDIEVIDDPSPPLARPSKKKAAASSSTTKKRASKATPSTSAKKAKTQKSTADDSKGGRKSGSTNYSDFELRVLVGFVSEVKPTGSDGWDEVTRRYNEVVQCEDLVARMKEGLKKKFYALVNSQKPTGDPDCPEVIRLAKRADRDIQEKTHTVDVDDSEADSGAESGESAVPTASVTPNTRAVATSVPGRDKSPDTRVVFKRELSTPTPSTSWAARKSSSQRTNAGAEALKQMTSFLDPSVRAQINNNQAVNNLFLSQIQSLEGQLRYRDEEMDKLRKEMREVERSKDAQMEGLRHEIRKLEKEVTDAQRASDRLESELQMLRMLQRHPMHNYRDHYTAYEDQDIRYRYGEHSSLARLEERRQRQGGTIFPPPSHRTIRSPSPSQRVQNTATRVPQDSSTDSLLVTFGNGDKITLSPSKRVSDP